MSPLNNGLSNFSLVCQNVLGARARVDMTSGTACINDCEKLLKHSGPVSYFDSVAHGRLS